MKVYLGVKSCQKASAITQKSLVIVEALRSYLNRPFKALKKFAAKYVCDESKKIAILRKRA